MTRTDREDSAQPASGSLSNSARVRSLTRLLIGGVEIGADEFLRRLHLWEQETAQAIEESGVQASRNDQPASTPVHPAESAAQQARLALIGLIFELQDQVRASVSTLGRLERWAARLVDPLLWPLRVAGILTPTQRIFERLYQRGQSEVEHWIAIGRKEEIHSRLLADKAYDDIVDTFIENLATNPEVQELVQTQSTGLAQEVVEEVRERTVSADTFLEGVARSLLRRVPRRSLPEPPPDVRAHAASLRPDRKGKRSTQ